MFLYCYITGSAIGDTSRCMFPWSPLQKLLFCYPFTTFKSLLITSRSSVGRSNLESPCPQMCCIKPNEISGHQIRPSNGHQEIPQIYRNIDVIIIILTNMIEIYARSHLPFSKHVFLCNLFRTFPSLSDSFLYTYMTILCVTGIGSGGSLIIGLCCLNSYPPGQNGHHFADDMFKRIFLNENIWISNKISLK